MMQPELVEVEVFNKRTKEKQTLTQYAIDGMGEEFFNEHFTHIPKLNNIPEFKQFIPPNIPDSSVNNEPDYAVMELAELKALAKQRGISFAGAIGKAKLIELLTK